MTWKIHHRAILSSWQLTLVLTFSPTILLYGNKQSVTLVKLVLLLDVWPVVSSAVFSAAFCCHIQLHFNFHHERSSDVLSLLLIYLVPTVGAADLNSFWGDVLTVFHLRNAPNHYQSLVGYSYLKKKGLELCGISWQQQTGRFTDNVWQQLLHFRLHIGLITTLPLEVNLILYLIVMFVATAIVLYLFIWCVFLKKGIASTDLL